MKFKSFACLSFSILFVASTFAEVKTGEAAPEFSLTSAEGKAVKLSDYKDKVVVLEWFNLGCPFVKAHYEHGDMQKLQGDFTAKGVVWLTINSTNPGHENYLSREKAAAQAKEQGIKATAVLEDSDGKVGRLYGAKSTPHMFIVDASGKLVYQGAIDDSPRGDPKKAKNHVRAALEEILAGKPVTTAETKQYGCSVKYPKG